MMFGSYSGSYILIYDGISVYSLYLVLGPKALPSGVDWLQVDWLFVPTCYSLQGLLFMRQRSQCERKPLTL